MDKLKKARRRVLAMAFIFTIMLVAGIPMIPVGFSLGYTFLGIIGIVFTAVGFYGCPLAWSTFGGYAPMVRVVYAIVHESMYSVSEIATYLRKNEKTVQGIITKCIDKLYLEGYFFDGEKLTLNENKKLKQKTAYTKCPNCGAPLPASSGADGHIRCPYCDTLIQ